MGLPSYQSCQNKKRKKYIKDKRYLNACTEIYRDGGSLELMYTADNGLSYCIWMEVVYHSPDDCKRYHPPILLKGSFYIYNIQPDDFISYVTWQDVGMLIDEIKVGFEGDLANQGHFYLIERLVVGGGWLRDE